MKITKSIRTAVVTTLMEIAPLLAHSADFIMDGTFIQIISQGTLEKLETININTIKMDVLPKTKKEELELEIKATNDKLDKLISEAEK